MKQKYVGGGLLNKHNSLKLQKFKEKNSKRKIILTAIILSILLLSGIYLYNSFAIFTEEKHFNVINGTIQDPGDIYFAYYVDGEITRSMPKQNTGYKLDTEKSECTNGVKVNWNYAVWHADIDYSNYNAGDYTRTRCNLYFVKENTVSTALGDLIVNSYTPDFSKSACDDETCESHEKGIYKTIDDDGTSYYYRGSVENNYVKFAGYYWRIIRINGNGSIRMIYDGTSAHNNGEISEDRIFEKTSFNPSADDNMYAGFEYKNGEVHGYGTFSNAKTRLNAFYDANLNSYYDFLDVNVGFCNDRGILNKASGVGTGRITTYYNGYRRISMSDPSLKCELASDHFIGGKGIGLITADEAMIAGHGGGMFNGDITYQKQTPNSYLTVGHHFWTMTPAGFYNTFGQTYYATLMFVINLDGYFDDATSSYSLVALRPVINLKSTLKFTGDGTKNNPYIPSL